MISWFRSPSSSIILHQWYFSGMDHDIQIDRREDFCFTTKSETTSRTGMVYGDALRDIYNFFLPVASGKIRFIMLLIVEWCTYANGVFSHLSLVAVNSHSRKWRRGKKKQKKRSCYKDGFVVLLFELIGNLKHRLLYCILFLYSILL